MKKKIKEIYKKSNLCCIYYDEDDTDAFIIGWVVAIDPKFFIIECVTPKGYHNGIACRLLDSVIKIETNNKYIESILKLWKINNQERFDISMQEKVCLTSLMNFIIENERVCFIEICNSANLDAVGYMKKFDNEKLLVEHISDCGEFDGEEDICIKRISAVTFGNEEQVRLEKLNKML